MFRADAQALANLFRTKAGRTVLVELGVVLVGLLAGTLALSSQFFLHDSVVEAVEADTSGTSARIVFSLALLLPALVVLGLWSTQLKGELYRAPHVVLLLSAPISSFAIVGRAFLRTLVSVWLPWVVLGLPPVIGLIGRTGLSSGAAWAYPVGVLLIAAPLVALQLLGKVAAVRWCSGPRARFALVTINATLGLGLVLGIALGFVKARVGGEWLGERLAAGVEVPAMLQAPAAFLAAGAGLGSGAVSWGGMLFLAILPAVLLGAAAALYRPSIETAWVAGGSTGARGRGKARGWPDTPVRSLLRKMWLECCRERSTLLAYVFFALLVVVGLANIEVGTEGALPVALREAFEVLKSWHLVALLVACISFLGLLGGDQKQLVLLMTSPVPRRDLVRSKMVLLFTPFLLCLLVAVVGAPVIAKTSLAGALLAVPMILPVTAFSVAAVFLLGSWPAFLRPGDEVPMASSMRAIWPAMLTGAAAFGGLLLVGELEGVVSRAYEADPNSHTLAVVMLACAWIVAALLLGLGYGVGVRNFTVQLDAQAEG